ncbi:MAG TPA: gliding motility-associated C-terminal domain-containing protein [Cyclobacteriaceae bacterium]|nr:gliding motility-associated C-terminal domain-containing protein [Cyclobacteriaceae bacterium]
MIILEDMKGVVVLSFFQFFIVSLGAQNLVPNPSFECGIDQCYYTTVSLDYQNNVCEWSCPTSGTSDIFSTTVPDISCYGFMPDNGIDKEVGQGRIGSQRPRTGNRFAGIYVYGPYEYREYLQARLAAPLVAGRTYCAELYVSLADYTGYASNNIGMYLHRDSVWQYSSSYLPLQPQIIDTRIIMDSINWVRIIGSFTATEPFQYLTIGNFFDNTNTAAEKKPFYKNYYEPWGYYFLDDVALYELTPHTFELAGETAICKGQSANLYATGALDDIEWSTLDKPSQIIAQGRQLLIAPEVTTSYLVTGKNCNLLVKDTVTIEVYDVVPVLLPDDTTICEGEVFNLDAGPGYVTYTWQDNSDDRFLKARSAGVYSVWAEQENGCRTYDEISIAVQHLPNIDIGQDRLLCEGNQEIRALGDPAAYLWSTGSTADLIEVSEPGQYWLIAENQCGQLMKTVSVYNIESIFIPNFLSLNGDGLNDKFEIRGIGTNETLHLQIFNRWGEKIYVNSDYDGDWPRKGADLPTGTYYYNLTVSDCTTFKGWLFITR